MSHRSDEGHYDLPMAVGRGHTVEPPNEWDRKINRRTDYSMILCTAGRGIISSMHYTNAKTRSRSENLRAKSHDGVYILCIRNRAWLNAELTSLSLLSTSSQQAQQLIT